MLHYLKQRLKTIYYRHVHGMSDADLNIMYMRRSGITVGEGCRIFTPVSSTEEYTAKYRDKAIDFSATPHSRREEFLKAHPEFLVRR